MSLRMKNSSGRFSPNRTDGALYSSIRMDTATTAGIVETPVRAWVGFYDNPASRVTTATLSGNINASVTALTISVSVLKGNIVQIDSEQMLVKVGGTGITVSRGFNGTTAASHTAGAALTLLGALTCQFTGVVDDVKESSKSFTVNMQCVDRAGLLLQQQESSAVYQNQTADSLIDSYLGLLPSRLPYVQISSGQRSLDQGLYPIPYAFLDGESILVECAKAAAATLEISRSVSMSSGWLFHS